MNENRALWGLHGLTGYFIAVVLLLSILAFLTAAAIKTQSATAHQAYEIKNPQAIKKFGPDLENEKQVVIYGSPVGGDKLHKYEFKQK
ncbi:DUF4006 family protein [Nitrosophilus kaiyonis]|uniref:DUF4006 family protein n=1 Tax=Nitrosophilus kaiyonis TaxID=2930200 RepID=UPI0024924D49|nr:DUF4006 family protein [Nitrosophilus kaiyonis]